MHDAHFDPHGDVQPLDEDQVVALGRALAEAASLAIDPNDPDAFTVPSSIFVNGNLARILLAAHKIRPNAAYLDEAAVAALSCEPTKRRLVASFFLRRKGSSA